MLSTCFFCTWKLVHFDHLYSIPPPSTPHLWWPQIWLLFLWVYLFLKHHWPTPLCQFLVHSVVIQYFYTAHKEHHASSYHLPPYKDITLLLTISPMLYISFLWLIYFTTGSLSLFILLICFTHPYAHLCSSNDVFVSGISDSVSLCLFIRFGF